MIDVQSNKNRVTGTWLGYSGLIPFIVFALASWSPAPWSSYATEILLSYAAVILGFMGAVHWGAALTRREQDNAMHFIGSVIPPLVAWIALLIPIQFGLLLLTIGFVVLYRYDLLVNKALCFSSWYMPMRKRLTIIVSACLFVCLLAQIFSQS